MGRSWKARAGVNRSVRLVEGFAEPVLDNSLNAALSGNLQRRLSVFVAHFGARSRASCSR
jgi:hypothetical protein